MIRREDYGPVMIFGYYDDDEDGNAIVYLGAPFDSAVIRVPYRAMHRAEKGTPAFRRWIKRHAPLAARMGVEERTTTKPGQK